MIFPEKYAICQHQYTVCNPPEEDRTHGVNCKVRFSHAVALQSLQPDRIALDNLFSLNILRDVLMAFEYCSQDTVSLER